MINTRLQRAKANIVTTLLYQIITVICGILIPKIFIENYGSEMYGATASITQFLAYITLLEGGIGGVARAELYQPLAENNTGAISKIYNAVRRWFSIIGCVFLAYTIVLACSYHRIADVSFFDVEYTFLLVIVISISTAAQYFFGIAKLTLLNADQKRYVSNIIMIVTTVINAVLVVALVHMGCDILTVKLCSSCIFVLRPFLFSVYVRKHYQIDVKQKADGEVLKQKWTGLGQHLAYYLHTNTDIAVLTIFADLKYVAVYSVYNLVVSSIRNITTSLTGGMEAVFGDMIAKKEQETLRATYQYYDMFISFATLVLFCTAEILVIPFVKLYTKGVADAQYIQPMFAVIILLAEAINCMFLPCSTLPIAANMFEKTKWGAYGEALINVAVSCALVSWNPLVGVAIGTMLSVLFKNVYYFIFASRNILHIPVEQGKKYILYIFMLLFVTLVGCIIIEQINIDSFIEWAACGCVAFVGVCGTAFLGYALIYGKQFINIAHRMFVKILNKRKM